MPHDRKTGSDGQMERMTQEKMKILIPRKLGEIEQEYGIRILYAAESGSRAWGTCHEKSDFDVRFIYIRPVQKYLKLEEEKDVLEFPIEDGWDMCCWDLQKLLKLHLAFHIRIRRLHHFQEIE